MPKQLVVIETHPIQYHVPVYRALERDFGVPVQQICASDFSISGYFDSEFKSSFAWDVDLLDGCNTTFLSRVSDGGARSFEEISAKGLRHALRTADPGAILLTGYQPSFHLWAWWAALRSGRPLLLRAETTEHARERSGPKRWIRKLGLRRLYRSCDRLLPIGRRSYQHYRALGCPEEKLVFAPYCVDTSAFRCDEVAREELREPTRQSLKVGAADMVLMFAGKLSVRKGVYELVKAVKQLPENLRQRTVLLFVGGGSEQEILESMLKAEPPVRAQFLGFRNQTELSPYYHSADLLLLPSVQSETWGLVVNEALHHGLPVVVSDAVGCAPDLVEPGITGELACAGSVTSLSQAVTRATRLIDSALVRGRCREKVEAYSVASAARGIADAYHGALKERSSAKP